MSPDDTVPRIGAPPDTDADADAEVHDLGMEDRLTMRGRTAITLWLGTLSESARMNLSSNDCSALLDSFVEMARHPDDTTVRCLAREIWPLDVQIDTD